MKDKVLCFDMDMTLLCHHNWAIPESAIEAIERARQNHYIVIATGRDMDTPESIPLLEQVMPDGCVHNNGSRVTLQEEVIFDTFIEPTILYDLIQYGLEKGLLLGTILKDKQYYTYPSLIEGFIQKMPRKEDRQEARKWFKNYLPIDALYQQKVKSMMYMGELEVLQELKSAFPMLEFMPNTSEESPFMAADIVPSCVNKARGIEVLLQHWNKTFEDVIAFGDSMNDYPMLQAAKIGVAMGNGTDALKAIADYVTQPAREDGIYNALVHLGVIE